MFSLADIEVAKEKNKKLMSRNENGINIKSLLLDSGLGMGRRLSLPSPKVS
jgi:hypothetical protein